MKSVDIAAALESFSPVSVSDEYCARYDAYDNSGILIDSGDDAAGVLFSLDFSLAAIAAAKKAGANVIVTHHPAIYGKVGNILACDPLGARLQRAIKGGISVISMHLNFDCAKDGIDEWLMRAVGGKEGIICQPLSKAGFGYGRVYEVEPSSAAALAERIKGALSTERVWCYGGEKPVRKVASFCGAGADEETLALAKKHGADCIVSADCKHHIVAAAQEAGLAVVQTTHYASENYGFEKIYERLQGQLGVKSEYFTDQSLL